MERKNGETDWAYRSPKEDVYAFYRDTDGKIKYNPMCLHCSKSCRQSFRSTILRCPNYADNRKKEHR